MSSRAKTRPPRENLRCRVFLNTKTHDGGPREFPHRGFSTANHVAMPRRILGDEVPSDDDASLRGAHANHPLAPREASFPGGAVYNLYTRSQFRGLVLGCIEADFCRKIVNSVTKHK